MKNLLLIILIFGLYSCEDRVNKSETKIVQTPTACPDEPSPSLRPSPINFKGIDAITNIEHTALTLNWNHLDGIYQYHVIQIDSIGNTTEQKIIKTIDAPTNSITLTGLTPNTSYSFIVRAMDKQGYLDQNMIIMTEKTLDWPNFANLRSLRFNGAQSLSLPSSSIYDLNSKITVSLWIRTSAQAANDQRLITLHKDQAAGSAISLGVQGQHVKLFYSNKNDELITNSALANYYDNNWHHLAISHNNTTYVVYFDGQILLSVKDSFSQFGSHPAHIAAYTGIQKAFVGNIDEVAFFKVALGTKDIEEIYNQGSATDLSEHSKKSKLVSWYRNGDLATDNSNQIEDNQGNGPALGINLNANSFEDKAP